MNRPWHGGGFQSATFCGITATTAQRRSDDSKRPVVSVLLRQLTDGLRVFSQVDTDGMLRVGVMPPGAPRLNANL
jgi:hypothetical protein